MIQPQVLIKINEKYCHIGEKGIRWKAQLFFLVSSPEHKIVLFPLEQTFSRGFLCTSIRTNNIAQGIPFTS